MNDEMSDSQPSARRPNERLHGLPTREDLEDLARTYREHLYKDWPELIGTPALPESTEASITAMADAYEAAYRSGQPQNFDAWHVHGRCLGIGAAYVRYSHKNSNTRSLDQQLANILRTAAKDRVFIPWNHVFGDAAIPGTTTFRPGYQTLCQLVQASDSSFDRLFVDDLDRLNRDELASLQFRRLLEAHRKRLTCTTGFDSSEPMAKMVSSLHGIQNEHFNHQLKWKVGRGMVDAFDQGRCVGALPLGYKQIPQLDALGKPVINRKQKCENDTIVDNEAAEVVRRIFRMFSEEKTSPMRIARRLNEERTLGKNSWGPSSITNILRNPRYIGQVVWRTTRTETNPATGKKMAVPRPEEEHLRREVPEMRIVSDELWLAVRQREREVSRNTHPAGKVSRQSQYPTRPFDLFCCDCGKPLQLARSGKYAQLFCVKGKEGGRGCTLKASKGLQIINECLLANLKLRLFESGALEHLLHHANALLAEEAAKPPVDTTAIDEQIAAATEKVKQLAIRVAELGGGLAADTWVAEIQQTEAKLDELKQQRHLAAQSNFRPAPIDQAAVAQLLDDLRKLIHDDPKTADAILAKSLGQVHVALGEKRGRTHAWLTDLSINPVPVLLEMARRTNCPTTHSLEYLHVRNWTIPFNVRIEINTIANYQRIAAKAAKLRAIGASINSIAVALMSDPSTVKQALRWAEENDGSWLTPADLSCRRLLENCKSDRMGPTVARMRDDEGKSFAAIARELDIAKGTVSRAYRQYHADRNLAAVSRGATLDSGPRRKRSQETIDEIRRLLVEGKLSGRKIAEQVGCAPVTVRLEKKRMEAEQAGEADGRE